ncbi:MAG: T9SS type A sorting domain-containing protein [Bacteroidetes bacterium]|nr:T9SS type A sorting domain-containing protein [Bacteroidota bacterium]
MTKILRKHKQILIILICFLIGPLSGFSTGGSFRSVLDGLWSVTTTWQEFISGSYTTATRYPVYGDRVTISNNVQLDVSLGDGTETHGFPLLKIAPTGNLTVIDAGLSVSIVIGVNVTVPDTLILAGSMTVGCFQVKTGAITLIRSTGSVTANNCEVNIASVSPRMVINGSLTVSTPATLVNTGIIYGTGSIVADNYSGSGGSVFGYTGLSGSVELYGFSWSGVSGGSWFTISNWTESTPIGRSTGYLPNDTIRATIPPDIGNIILDDTGKEAKVYSLVIHSGSSLLINPACKLTISNSVINLNGVGGIVINSEINHSGSLLLPLNEVTPYKPDGTVNIFVTGSADLNAMKYHFVSLPVDAATNSTSNIFLGSYLYDFNEGTNSWDNLGSSTTLPLDERRGYMTYYPGTSATYSITGKFNSGKFTPLITYTSPTGYNLVPNPFPSTIDWNSGAGWKKTGMGGTIYIWPAGAASSTENYASYNGTTGTHGGTQFIALGQSFIVQVVNSSYDFSMTNAVCTNQNATFLKDGELIPNLLRIKSVALNNNAYDEIVVHFREGATTAFDPEFDGNKLQGGAEAPQFSSVASDNSELCINSLPFSAGEIIVPLHFTFNATSQVSFTASGMESFNANVPVLLEDQLLGKMVNLRQDSVYTFNYEPANAIDRFRLHFAGLNGMEEHSAISGRAFAGKGKIFLEVPSMEGQEADVRVYNTLGQLVSNNSINMKGFVSVEAPRGTGIFIVQVASADKYFVTKVFNK